MQTLIISSIPHGEHRLEAGDTVGDWYKDKEGNTRIEVSEMSDPRYEFLVALHEQVEKVLCDHAGITEKQVDEFDFNWKEHDGITEAGIDIKAPYLPQHMIATQIERIVAEALEVDWEAYDKEVMSL